MQQVGQFGQELQGTYHPGQAWVLFPAASPDKAQASTSRFTLNPADKERVSVYDLALLWSFDGVVLCPKKTSTCQQVVSKFFHHSVCLIVHLVDLLVQLTYSHRCLSSFSNSAAVVSSEVLIILQHDILVAIAGAKTAELGQKYYLGPS